MRTISAARQGVINSGVQAEFVRVSVKDGGGTFRDLTTYPNFCALKSAVWKEDVTSPGATADIKLSRELFKLSLSPYMAGSALNRGFDPTASPVALIALSREIKIEVAVVPMDKQPASGDWQEYFHGRIDSFDAAQGQDITIAARDLSGRLQQQFIKTELVYSYAADGGSSVPLRIWAPQIAVTTSPLTYLLPASRGDADPGLNRFFKCSQGGTTGTAEPTWSGGTGITDGSGKWDYVGAPTTSGNPVEQVMQNILNDNKLTGDSTVTLYVPTSPSWNIRQFIQQRQFTFDAIKALANQIGWDVRYKWRAGTAQFEFTLFAPTRSAPSVDHVFGTGDYAEPTKLAADISEIRNSVRVIYADRADLWPDGSPKRKTVEVSDSASIAKYGELWCEIQEDETSNIDSSTEATTLANNALSDMKEPTAELDVLLTRGFPETEIGDYYTFTADGVRFDSDQSLAVVAWSQGFEAGQDGRACLKTSLQLRGLPTIGARTFIDKQNHPSYSQKKNTGHQLSQFQGAKTPALSFADTVGGTKISLGLATDKRALLEEYEIHVYTTPGSTLDSTTLAGLTKSREVVLSDLIPGTTYFSRAVPRFSNASKLIRSQPSTEQSFVAGQASAGHISSGLDLASFPLGGGFESRDDVSGLPSHWSLYSGTYGTNVVVQEDGNGMSGGRYLRLKGGGLRSADFPMIQEANESSRRGSLYRFHWWRKAGSSASTYSALIRLLAYDDSEVDILTIAGSMPVDKAGHWVLEELFCRLKEGDSTARSLQLEISGGGTGANQQIDIDEVRCQYLGTPWYEVGDTSYYTNNFESVPGFTNSWVNYAAGNTAAFRKDQFGRVELKGAISTGSIPSACFTLPVGFHPPENCFFPVDSNNAYGSIGINASTGVVTVYVGNNFRVDLWGIRFMTTKVANTTT